MFTWYLITDHINLKSMCPWCSCNDQFSSCQVVQCCKCHVITFVFCSIMICLKCLGSDIIRSFFCFISRLVKPKMLRKGWILQVLKTLRVLLLFYNLWFFLRKPCTEDGLTIHSSSYLFSCVTTLLWRKLGYKYSSWLWPFLYLGQ